MNTERLGILASGNGSTAAHIIENLNQGKIQGMELGCLVVCHENVPAIGKAKELKIDQANIVIVDAQKFRESGSVNMSNFGEALLEALVKRKVSVVSQNGWLHITPDNVVEFFRGSLFNQHPGRLLFGGIGMFGIRVHAATLEFEKLSGRSIGTQATVHRVTSGVDEGEVVGAVWVPTKINDTPETLSERVLPYEHELAVSVLRKYIDGDISTLPQEQILRQGEEAFLSQAIEHAKSQYPRGHSHKNLAA